MKFIWYLSSIITLTLILFYNPKTSTLVGFNENQKISSTTSESQKSLQIIISFNIFLFFLLTILISLYVY